MTKIDDLVPLLYKVRQQALAQKSYVNDILKNLLTDSFSSMDADRIITLQNNELTGAGLVESDKAVDTFSRENSANQRAVIQSLFKFKHDCGTSTHFTTEQIGNVTDRTKGLNLEDAIKILTGIKAILTKSNESEQHYGNMGEAILTQINNDIDEITPDKAVPIVNDVEANPNSYKSNNLNGIESLFEPIDLEQTASTFIGFGLGP